MVAGTIVGRSFFVLGEAFWVKMEMRRRGMMGVGV